MADDNELEPVWVHNVRHILETNGHSGFTEEMHVRILECFNAFYATAKAARPLPEEMVERTETGHKFKDAMERSMRSLADPTKCGCWRCIKDRGEMRVRMIRCPQCGCKRCPRASNHALACTGSNEPGQPGSFYE